MSKQILQLAGDAFRRGAMAEVAELIDASLIDAADDAEAADRLRFVRAYALVECGHSQAALVMLDAMAPQRRDQAAALKLAARAALAADDLDCARRALALLVKAGDRDAAAAYQATLVRRGLQAVAARDFPVALEALRAAHIQHIQDVAARYAAWLGLLAAAEAAEPAAIAAVFAMCPGWRQDRRANLIAARAAIATRDVAGARRHLEALGAHADAWPQWWALCRSLLAAARYDDVVVLFSGERTGQPAAYTRAVAIVVAIALYALRRHDESQHAIERLALALPDDGFVAHVAAFLAFSARNYERTERHLRRVSDESPPVMLLRWAVLFGRERYDPVRAALTPEAVRAWPEGAEREAAGLMASLANVLTGSPSRGWAVLRTAGDPTRANAPAALRYLGGYLALGDRQYALAAILLGASPLGALARVEYARDVADSGDYDAAFRELDGASGRGHDAVVIDTRNRIRLQRAEDAMRAGDMASASRLLAGVRSEAPQLVDRVVGLEDYAAVRSTLSAIKGGDPSRLADAIWQLSETPQPEGSELRVRNRRRDLAYLTGALRLRAMSRAPERAMLAPTIAALEAALDEDFSFPPAAGILGILLQYTGERGRALELLDIANRGGLSTPRIQGALAIEYVRDGRLVEAKRIFFEQVAVAPGNAVAAGRLDEIFVYETTPLLRTRVAEPARAVPKVALEVPELPAAVDPFADVDPRHRLLVLIRRTEGKTGELADIVRELKRLAVQGMTSRFADLERRALGLLARGST